MAKEKTKESFVMYDSFIQAAAYLPGEEFKECILKIRDYALYGIDELSNNPAINIVMAVAKPNLDAAEKRRKQAIENGSKGAPFGNQGGAMRKGETREEYDARRLSTTPDNPQATPNEPLNNPQLTPSEPLNVNVNVNDNVKENENEEGKVNETVNGNEDGTVNVQGDINLETLPSPSPSSCPSLNPSSSLQNTFERPQQLDNNDIVIPTCYGPEKLENKTNKSSGGGAAASADGGMSASEYLNQIYHENMQILKNYRLNNLDFDEKSKKAHYEATHAFMNYFGKSYEEACDFVSKTLNKWVDNAKKELASRTE